MSSQLPKPSGEYSVGFVDFEAECDGINVLVRLYYPTNTTFTEGASWLPSSSYFPSYGYYLRVPMMLYTPLARFVMGGVKQWALEDAQPIAQKFLGTVVFSHGLAGIRTTYSVICTELASQGYAVAAIEHRDGSASMTLTAGGETVMPYKYIDAEVEDELQVRKEQLDLRCREVEATIKCLKAINAGAHLKNLWMHGRKEPKSLDFLKSKFSIEEISLMGHSFGAATMLKYASKVPSEDLKVIALDPWMYAMPSEPEKFQEKIKLLVIDMEQFQWPENLSKIKAHVNAWSRFPEMYTVVNGSHQQVSDVPMLTFGSFMIKKGSPPTQQVLRAISQLSLIFFLEGHVPTDVLSKFENLIRKIIF